LRSSAPPMPVNTSRASLCRRSRRRPLFPHSSSRTPGTALSTSTVPAASTRPTTAARAGIEQAWPERSSRSRSEAATPMRWSVMSSSGRRSVETPGGGGRFVHRGSLSRLRLARRMSGSWGRHNIDPTSTRSCSRPIVAARSQRGKVPASPSWAGHSSRRRMGSSGPFARPGTWPSSHSRGMMAVRSPRSSPCTITVGSGSRAWSTVRGSLQPRRESRS